MTSAGYRKDKRIVYTNYARIIKQDDRIAMATRTAKRKEKTNRDQMVIFRTTEEMKAKAQAVKALMQVTSTSEVFRTLLNQKAEELGVS